GELSSSPLPSPQAKPTSSARPKARGIGSSRVRMPSMISDPRPPGRVPSSSAASPKRRKRAPTAPYETESSRASALDRAAGLAMVRLMARGRRGRGLVGGCVAVGLLLAPGCRRHERSVEPGPSASDCNPADDCNDLFGGSNIRQHSPQAGTFAEVSAGCPYAPDEVPPL